MRIFILLIIFIFLQSATRDAASTSAAIYGSVTSMKKQQNASFAESSSTIYGSVSNFGSNGDASAVDCTICYENPIDSVLYMCGHMCMCFDCAMKHWRGGSNGGYCPLCRAPIRDVIRTYRS